MKRVRMPHNSWFGQARLKPGRLYSTAHTGLKAAGQRAGAEAATVVDWVSSRQCGGSASGLGRGVTTKGGVRWEEGGAAGSCALGAGASLPIAPGDAPALAGAYWSHSFSSPHCSLTK